MSGHIASTRSYVLVFLALIVGTGLTYAAALVDFGFFNNVVMGFIGGLFPAIRAARLPVVTALRQL